MQYLHNSLVWLYKCVHSYFLLSVEEKKKKKSPEDLIQPGCSSAVQFDPCISEGGFIAWGESHHFLGNAMKKAAVKCLQGCPGSSCFPGVLAVASLQPRGSASSSSGEEAGGALHFGSTPLGQDGCCWEPGPQFLSFGDLDMSRTL